MSAHTTQEKVPASLLHQEPTTSRVLRAFLGNNVVVFFALLAINLVCCGASLNMFFFAEDMVHVVHAYNFFNGMPHYFWTNFYSVWMNDNVHTCFYRPLPELTFALDYMLFATKPFGYHLTNLILHQFGTFTFFCAANALLRRYNAVQARVAAVISAAIFAACPLHPEAINWLVNRTDLMCMVFMMLSWFGFIKQCGGGGKPAKVLALVSMLLALMSKESAISLPPLMVLTYLYLKADNLSWKSIVQSLQASAAFWALLLAYVVFRVTVLHGLGGYVGSLATMMADTFVERLTSTISWLRCFYPLNECLPKEVLYVFGPLLSIVYTLAGILVAARFKKDCWSEANTRILLFSTAAFIVTVAPSIQLWSILSNMLNTRLMYVPSAFLALIVVAAILPIGFSSRRKKWFWRIGIAWCALFAIVSGTAHIANNEPWLYASSNLQNLSTEYVKALKALPNSDKVAVLNLPLDERNPLTMCCRWHLMMPAVPPFCDVNFGTRVAATQMSWFNSEIKNPSRIEEFISVSTNHGLIWDASTKQLVDCPRGEFPRLGASLDGVVPLQHKGGAGEPSLIYTLPTTGLDARLAGMIKVTMAPIPMKTADDPLPSCTLIWNSYDRPEVTSWRTIARRAEEASSDTIYFPMAERVRWRLSPQRLHQLIFTPSNGYEIKSIDLIDESSVVPKLAAADVHSVTLDGLYVLKEELSINFDSSKIQNATSTVVEISAPNLRFHELSSTYRDSKLNKHAYKRIAVPSTQGAFVLCRKMFGPSAKYDVRVVAVSKDNEVVGFTSDPLEVEVH